MDLSTVNKWISGMNRISYQDAVRVCALLALTDGEKKEFLDAAGYPGTTQASLATLPDNRDTVFLPSHIPDEPYYHLPGREERLRQLLSALADPQGAPAIVIDGLGGMGKTAFVVEVIRRALKQQFFIKVVGESAKQEQFTGGAIVRISEAILDFERLLDAIARQLDHWEIPTLPVEEKHTRLAQLLRQTPYLILVDNLETVDNAQELLAKLRGFLNKSRVLVTSRQKVHHDFVLPLSLHELSQDDSLFFLQQDIAQRGRYHSLSLSQERLLDIYRVTQGAPLAMKLVVAQALHLDPTHVLHELEQAKGNIYPFVFRQSWEELSLEAQLILIYIGKTVVTTVSHEELAELEEIAENEQQFLEAIRQLIDYSLLDVYHLPDQTRYGIHQLTRKFVISDLPQLWQEHGQG
ncbi:MAG TPA: ATP-binding protein [Ktedonobacteraceae bacterium]|nr:ATP-binding protein [Ktedonobacteraceae bacterium]